jgi:AcrR family transcriptional regulator
MPKAFSDQEKELINKRLLDQGYQLFSTYGLKRTNVEDIARAVGISKGAFYHFYPSKEALFLDSVEQAEIRVRQEILAAVELPGSTPRAQLFRALKRAFDMFQELPILRFFSGSDFELLFTRVPPEQLQEHLTNDRTFIAEMVRHCQENGIPICASEEQLVSLLYPLVLPILYQESPNRFPLTGNVDALLELVAAFCLGEITLQSLPLVPRKQE